MKRYLPMLSLAFLAACQLETFVVKTDPTYEIPLGRVEATLNEFLTADALADLGDLGAFTLAREVPASDSEPLTFVFSGELGRVSPSSFTGGDDDFTAALGVLNETIPTTSITLPSISFDPVNFNLTIPGGYNQLLDAQPLPFSGTATIPVSAEPSFRGGTIGVGSVIIEVDAPENFTSTNRTLSLTIHQNGVELGQYGPISIPGPVDPAVFNVDLAGLTFGAGDLEVQYNFTQEGTFSDNNDGTMIFTVRFDIDSFSSLTVVFDAANLNQSINQAIDPAVRSLVKEVTLSGDSQLSLNLINGLPVNMSLALTSPELGLSENLVFTANATSAQEEIISLANLVIDLTDPAFDDGFNFDLAVTLSGFDPSTNELTLTNVVLDPPPTYSFSGSVSADLTPVSLTLGGTGVTGTIPDPSSAFAAFLPVGVSFAELPLDLTISGLPNLTGTASLWSTWGDPVQTFDIFNPETDPSTVEAVNITTDGTGGLTGWTSRDLAPYFAQRAENATLNYDLQVGSLTIDLVNPPTNDIVIGVSLRIPLTWDIDDGDPATSAVLLDLSDFGLDVSTLDSRTEATELDDLMQDVLDGIKTVTLSVKDVENTTGLSLRAVLRYSIPTTNAFGQPDTLEREYIVDLGSGNSAELTLEAIDLEHILGTAPFQPTFELFLNEGSNLVVQDSARVAATVVVKVQSNLDISIPVKGSGN